MASLEAAPREKRTPSDLNDSATILIVDDLDFLVESVGEILEDAEFRVLTALGGRKGIETFKEHNAEIDLVLLDLRMPELNGFAVLEVIEELRPDVKVILTSGFNTIDESDKIKNKNNVSFLAKPYSHNDLLGKINALLG